MRASEIHTTSQTDINIAPSTLRPPLVGQLEAVRCHGHLGPCLDVLATKTSPSYCRKSHESFVRAHVVLESTVRQWNRKLAAIGLTRRVWVCLMVVVLAGAGSRVAG